MKSANGGLFHLPPRPASLLDHGRLALKFHPGQPGKVNAVASDVLPACTSQNFKNLGRGAGGGLSLRRKVKETPTDQVQSELMLA